MLQAQNLTALQDLNTTAINATLPESTDKQTGVLLPNPPAPACEVGIDIKFVNTSLGLQDPTQPTASPVPSVVLGSLSLQLANLQDNLLLASPHPSPTPCITVSGLLLLCGDFVASNTVFMSWYILHNATCWECLSSPPWSPVMTVRNGKITD